MHDTGCLGLVHWDDPEGWYGEGGGRRVHDGEHMYTCGRFILEKKKKKEKNLLTINTGGVWRKGNPLSLLVGMQTSTDTMENSVGIP